MSNDVVGPEPVAPQHPSADGRPGVDGAPEPAPVIDLTDSDSDPAHSPSHDRNSDRSPTGKKPRSNEMTETSDPAPGDAAPAAASTDDDALPWRRNDEPKRSGSERNERPGWFVPAVLAGLAVLALGLFGQLSALGVVGDDSGDENPGTGETAAGTPASETDATTSDGAASTPDSTPDGSATVGGPAPAVSVPESARGFVSLDSFNRGPSAELGRGDSGRAWVAQSGEWGIDSAGTASATLIADSGPTIATFNLGTPDASFQASLPTMVAGSGIVFRFENLFNYWTVTSAPNSGTWTVTKVFERERTDMGTIGPAKGDDGVTIGVDASGDTIQFYVDGQLATEIDDDDLSGSTSFGLILDTGVSGARFDNVSAFGRVEAEDVPESNEDPGDTGDDEDTEDSDADGAEESGDEG